MTFSLRERENLVALKAVDIAPGLFNKHFTSICLKDTNQFFDMVADKAYNTAPGSYFDDDQKAYFFNPPLCYIIRDRVTK